MLLILHFQKPYISSSITIKNSISLIFKNQITSLHEHTFFLQSFLDDFPYETRSFEEKIREVTAVAEDTIELLLSDSLLESTVGTSKPNFDFGELQRVTKEIESIVEAVKGRHTESVDGFNEDLMKIISKLLGGSSEREIIPIVGMGGIGKTTLARNAYDNPVIVEHFEIRAWVTVSPDFSRREIILGLLDSMDRLDAGDESNSLDNLIVNLELILSRKRYLIVIDDLWNIEFWDMLKIILPDNSNGSRIIVTTRLSRIASDVNSSCRVHEMTLMDVDQSWNLLRQKIFKGDPCPAELVDIGKMIARSCRGLPLAIAVISGILTAHQTQAAWEDIAENEKTVINVEDDDHLFRMLHLSYIYLPHHLRPCFLYLGIFPDNHEIHVSKLIKLWVAEGFLDEIESKSFEETGEEYLEDLVSRSLVSVSKRKSDGRIKSVSIHDLLKDLFIMQARKDFFFLVGRSNYLGWEAKELQRRVSTFYYNHDFLENVYGSTIRTIICLEGSRAGYHQVWLGRFRLLRILDLSNAYDFFHVNDLPEELFELFHLRYLAFDHQFSIPEAISNLQNLQTLIIRPKNSLGWIVKLPIEIWRMPQLRHVVLSCVFPSQEEEEATFALENLQTLTQAANFICSRETLKMIPNLKKLAIFYTLQGDVEEAYQLHNLIHLPKLETLKIEALKQYGLSPAFPPTLKKLSLSGVRLPLEDMKIVGSLPNLQVLKLRENACIGTIWETNEGGFSQLSFLLIHNSDVERWITECCHFPRLKCLLLHRCRRLRDVPNDTGEIPTLELIEVYRWNKSLVDWAKRIHEDQLSMGNDSLQVRFV